MNLPTERAEEPTKDKGEVVKLDLARGRVLLTNVTSSPLVENFTMSLRTLFRRQGYISTQMERDLRIMGFPELADQFEQTFHSHPAKGLPNTRAVRRFKVHLEPSKTSG